MPHFDSPKDKPNFDLEIAESLFGDVDAMSPWKAMYPSGDPEIDPTEEQEAKNQKQMVHYLTSHERVRRLKILKRVLRSLPDLVGLCGSGPYSQAYGSWDNNIDAKSFNELQSLVSTPTVGTFRLIDEMIATNGCAKK